MPVGSVVGQYSDICSYLRCLKDINMHVGSVSRQHPCYSIAVLDTS